MSAALMKFLNWILDKVEAMPSWEMYLILSVLLMGSWFLAGLAFVSIARSMG